MRAAVQKGVDAANAKLARVEQIKKFTLVRGDWLPGGDELTPTMKLKRKPIAEKYAGGDRGDVLSWGLTTGRRWCDRPTGAPGARVAARPSRCARAATVRAAATVLRARVAAAGPGRAAAAARGSGCCSVLLHRRRVDDGAVSPAPPDRRGATAGVLLTGVRSHRGRPDST